MKKSFRLDSSPPNLEPLEKATLHYLQNNTKKGFVSTNIIKKNNHQSKNIATIELINTQNMRNKSTNQFDIVAQVILIEQNPICEVWEQRI